MNFLMTKVRPKHVNEVPFTWLANNLANYEMDKAVTSNIKYKLHTELAVLQLHNTETDT